MSEWTMCPSCGRPVEAGAAGPGELDVLGRVAGIAHDLGNVLVTVSGSAEMMQERVAMTDENYEDVQAILDAAERGTGLKQQLLAIARRQQPALDRVDLNEVIRDVMGVLGRQIDDRITVVRRLDKDGVYVYANRSQLEQVVMNLVLNARDAIEGLGTIVVSTSHDQAMVRLRVADDGAGMTAALQGRIFEPYFTTKRETGGTGLGLATVRALVTSAGGSIDVHSTVGVGSSFEVRLPVAP